MAPDLRGPTEWLDTRIVGSVEFYAPIHGGEFLHKAAAVPAALEDLLPLAPPHQPHDLVAVRALSRWEPDLPPVACSDTGFRPPPAHRRGRDPLRVPRAVVRVGGVGPAGYRPPAAAGRPVVAHPGNGASLCAMLGGRSVATTMSSAPAGGRVMGTRCGAPDPGVLLGLRARHRLDALEHPVSHESGRPGVSGVSGDMRELLASPDPRAAGAVDLFVYRVGRELWSLAAAHGGLDALVFTGGTGEKAVLDVRAKSPGPVRRNGTG